ncbi:10215_t:CDS:10 [Ambispora leptoticha]|uniref:Ataxin-10 homolog n=1 Tax=Ambispora leptoticha TaxID=144679 RepID=A0A9N9FGU8_9GLOM|nr:10215_t:CDS:10 [Ambispora leptoticha]
MITAELQSNRNYRNELSKNKEFLEKSIILTKNFYDELSSKEEEKRGKNDLDLSPSYLELTMWLLRMIRNFVAEIEANQNSAVKFGWHKIIEKILFYCISNLHRQQNQQSTQALSNIITGNSITQKIIWDELLLSPSKDKIEPPNEDLLSKLASCGDDIILLSTLVLVFNTIHDNESLCIALIESSTGTRLLKIILYEVRSFINEEEDILNEEKETKKSFELIDAVMSRIIELDLFPLLFEKLYESEAIGPQNTTINQDQIILLKLLYSKIFNDNSPLSLPKLSQTCSHLICLFNSITPEIIKEMEAIKNDNNTTNTLSAELESELIEDGAISAKINDTCLRLLLNIFGDLSQSLDDEINEANDCNNKVDIREYLFKNGILTSCIVSNLAYENRIVQDKVRKLGGIQLILNQCNIDDNNPFLREQSIFAIRNLLYQNSENQKLVGELTPIRAVQSDDLGIGIKTVGGPSYSKTL